MTGTLWPRTSLSTATGYDAANLEGQNHATANAEADVHPVRTSLLSLFIGDEVEETEVGYMY